MLLTLYDMSHTRIAGLINAKDVKIESELNTGDKTLSFQWSQKSGQKILQEYYIRSDQDEFVVKENSKGAGEYRNITGKLNLEEIEGKPWISFLAENCTAKEMADMALTGTGWTCISTVDANKIRNLSLAKVNSYQVFESILGAFTCEVKWDTINKIVYLMEQVGEYKGIHFIDGVNLRELTDSGDTYDYVTRIVPIGADNLGIADVNGGVDYLTNNQYSSKEKFLIWEDSNYTDAQALLEDARYKLDELSKPKRTYSCKVIDLGKCRAGYEDMGYAIGDQVWIVSANLDIRERQRITKMEEYPENPEKNTCEISNTKLTFEEMQKKLQAAADAIGNVTTNNGTLKGSAVDKIDVTQIIGMDQYVEWDADEITVKTLYASNQFGTPYAVIGSVLSTEAEITNLKVVKRAEIALAYLTESHTTNAYGDYAKFTVIEADNLSAMEEIVDNLKANAITTDTIEAKVATLGYATIDLANVEVGSINTALIADGAIGTVQISDGSITDAKIVDLTADKITAGTLDAASIDVINLNAANITVGTINGYQIASGAIDLSKLGVDVIGQISTALADAAKGIQDAESAMDAAIEASGLIETMEIGGKNLLQNSQTLVFDGYQFESIQITDGDGFILTDAEGNILIE